MLPGGAIGYGDLLLQYCLSHPFLAHEARRKLSLSYAELSEDRL